MPGPVAKSPLSIQDLDQFIYGSTPNPVHCRRGVEIGTGTVVPEINFTLPPIEINESTWSEIQGIYRETIDSICQRAVALEVPSFLVEFETLPPMTVNPDWGVDITRILVETLDRYHDQYGLKGALRLTPNDNRDHERPPLMRRGRYWEKMVELFERGVAEGADMLAIESTGGKEVCDDALMTGDLKTVVFALGVLSPRDMEFLWKEMVRACGQGETIPSGDTACGFANTAMALADQNLISRVFAAIVRVLSVPRNLVAYEVGALGPSKDCAYEGPYVKAITGVPISMEGKTSACAHLTHMGNIAQAVCDCWSNESVQAVRLLSASAPIAYLEQLAYDCRLMNTASAHSSEDAIRLRDWLVESDASLDPQAYVLRPDVVLRISKEIVEEETPYGQVRRAAQCTFQELKRANENGLLHLPKREQKWLNRLEPVIQELPESEADLIEEMLPNLDRSRFLPEEYGLSV
ncbi:MAG: methanol--corrinoid methyltransferase [Candidatus Omnitrophica bacterium]|nr:methanol--corrinoid methyltransferase [Candidatus Omnitrophota bacterium]MCB9768341.1 methanol--corrinoid methyltransferase [Candidatus Omnitrophota bacterium]MCB9783167.1 methanol--corrinoid methyltransferase [Candidatus Omnitrophota bacterium]